MVDDITFLFECTYSVLVYWTLKLEFVLVEMELYSSEIAAFSGSSTNKSFWRVTFPCLVSGMIERWQWMLWFYMISAVLSARFDQQLQSAAHKSHKLEFMTLFRESQQKCINLISLLLLQRLILWSGLEINIAHFLKCWHASFTNTLQTKPQSNSTLMLSKKPLKFCTTFIPLG